MALSRSEFLTLQFYEWEKRGRGWHVFEHPVQLEPEFVPFSAYKSNQPHYIDDAKRPSIFGKVGNLVKKALTPATPQETEVIEDEYPVKAYPFECNDDYCVFALSMPESFKATGQEATQFLTMLSYCRFPISFEIVATQTTIRIQLVCREADRAHVFGQLKVYFPECIIQEGIQEYLHLVQPQPGVVLDFGLQEEFTRPLAMSEKVAIDPYTGLFGIMEHLHEDETIVLQVLFHGAANPWAESIMQSVTDSKGGSFFEDAPEMPNMAADKISAPLFGVTIRLLTQSPTQERARHLMVNAGNTLVHISKSEGNTLIPLSENGYPIETHLTDITERTSHRLGMLLNSRELATFVHYPSGFSSTKLVRDLKKTKAPPAITQGYDFILGRNIHQGVEAMVTIEPSQRLKHMHVIGATGTGKSTLLQSCIVQDILLGNGVAVLDPHGDLIESILPYIPEHRFNDVIIVDPSDANFPVGFNILSAHSDVEKEILASDLVAVFRRLSTSFGDQMHSVLANAILAFLESSTGGTLIDLRRFLIEKPYREEFLKTVSDPNIVYYWQKEYPLLKTSSIGPILTRLDSFLRPKLIRNMVAQKKGLDFENILDTQKIIFIKLSQGLIGTENSYLLGTIFVSKIYQAAMARQAQAKTDRKNFFLYIDEFQNFITPSMSSILSGTRKYGLGCILAHQDMIQLQKVDAELSSSVVSNAGTRICFRVGDIDAKRFESGFSFFEAEDIQNLGTGEAIARIERPEFDFTLNTMQLKDVDPEQAEAIRNSVALLSRERYGTPKEEVEQSLEYLRTEEKIQPERPVVEVQQKKESKITEEQIKKTSTKVKETIQEEDTEPKVEIVTVDEAKKAKTKERLIQQKEISQHRYIQILIKKMAEARGYKATIEEPLLDGQGRVDVSLLKDNKKIACEVGVTTTKQWEVHNVEKCLEAGYDVVIAVPIDASAKDAMQKKVEEHVSEKYKSKVRVMETDQLFRYLDEQNAQGAETERIKGYRVRVKYNQISQEEMNEKRDTIAKIVVDSKKKKHNK